MEHLEIHSRSYLIRWIEVSDGHTIAWSVRPEKRSINFGIFKHPGAERGAAKLKIGSTTVVSPPTDVILPTNLEENSQDLRQDASSEAAEKLQSIGLRLVHWHGACSAGKVASGQFNVSKCSGGIYALVFDNTFAKQYSKKAVFVLLTFPTDRPPEWNRSQVRHHNDFDAAGSRDIGNVELNDPAVDSIDEDIASRRIQSSNEQETPGTTSNISTSQKGLDRHDHPPSDCLTGTLQKRRRRKGQGWASRFFSLDFTTSTLSYYHDRNSSSLRGSIPLSLAAIGYNAVSRQISIDSGAEIWQLKTASTKDFEAWCRALERAASNRQLCRSDRYEAISTIHAPLNSSDSTHLLTSIASSIEGLLATARTLVATSAPPRPISTSKVKDDSIRCEDEVASNLSSPKQGPASSQMDNDLLSVGEPRPFWKRNPSTERSRFGPFRRSPSSTPPTLSKQSSQNLATQTGLQSPALKDHDYFPSPIINLQDFHTQSNHLLLGLSDISKRIDTLLRTSELTQTKQRSPRHSIASRDDIFYDADGLDHMSLLDIADDASGQSSEQEYHSGLSSSSETESLKSAPEHSTRIGHKPDTSCAAFPLPVVVPAILLTPLSEHESGRVISPSIPPPSLIGFLRKNVGKDLSTVALPVTANEPISLLQRTAEILEHSSLLDQAANTADGGRRLTIMAAFAISSLSSLRSPERALRKPFNPMLGETFELVSPDSSYCLVAEKVTHRPVRVACQADSKNWSLTHSPCLTQKFWGKSAEVTTDGKIRVRLESQSSRYSWTPPTYYLRNVIAGEKYIEPGGTMTIVDESSGSKAIVTFKKMGIFSGRSEEVNVSFYDPNGHSQNFHLAGTWTKCLTLHRSQGDANEIIWSCADLPAISSKCYGFTRFAQTLNELTEQQKPFLPPTDSRLRPDQRCLERGEISMAEDLKFRLENAQRNRRQDLEAKGASWRPAWFERVKAQDGEDAYVVQRGLSGYWERRQNGQWNDVPSVFIT